MALLTQADALLIVDVQNDFLPGGSLAVPSGNEIVPLLNHYIDLFHQHGLPIITSRDWHPANHCSFKAQGGPWPPHCVADTKGAAFPSNLNLPDNVIVISKATESNKDAYSAFADTNLSQILDNKHIKRLFIGGLATDYCVFNTVKDAIKAKFQVMLLIDSIRAVNVDLDDGKKAENAMQKLGAIPITLEALQS